MSKLLILEPEGFSREAVENLSEFFSIEYGLDKINEDLKNAKPYQVLFCRLAIKLDENFLDNFKDLRYICTPTTGLDHIDLVYCRKNKIKVISLRDCRENLENIYSTVEISFYMMLHLVRKIPSFTSDDALIKWDRNVESVRECSSLKVGVIGYGRLGKKFVSLAQALGMDVLIYDTEKRELDSRDNSAAIVDRLDFLLSESDIIVVHASYNSGDKPIINEENINKLKAGAILINTARGGLISTEVVLRALKTGRLGGLGFDVLEGEECNLHQKYIEECMSLKSQGYNILLTPHIGGRTVDAMQKTEQYIVDSLLEQYAG